MRQLHVQVRADQGSRVLEIANEHKAFSPTSVTAERADGEAWKIIFLNLPNDRVGSFVWDVKEEVDEAQFVLFPRGTLPIQMPLDEVKGRIRDVSHRSTLELVLDSLQSVGSWKGMLLYALFSGVVATYGILFSTSYLLVAAMLIAPMGAPVMVSVVGAALGDWRMFGRGALRFLAAIVMLIVSSIIVGYAYGLTFSTTIMESITSLSSWAVAVALVAGAAGAQSQVQSERSSLVTGTATGFLIAAALSPTAAVLGLAIVIERWTYVGLMGFQLTLQFVAIVTGGWLSLLLYGVEPGDPSTGRGSNAWRIVLVAGTALASLGLVWWQTQHAPVFVKADLSREAIELARDAVRQVPGVQLIEANAHFTRPDQPNRSEEGLLLDVVVEQTAAAPSSEPLESAVRSAIKRSLHEQMPDVLPFINVSVLPGSATP